MKVNIQVTGLKETQAKLNRYGQSIGPQVIRAEFQKAADEVVIHAQKLAPIDTGYLRSNISVDEVNERGATITSNAEYSSYQSVDFMGDAMNAVGGKLVNNMKTAVANHWKKS